MFPSVLEGGEKGEQALTLAQMTTNHQTHLRAAGMEDKPVSYTHLTLPTKA